MSAFSLVAEDLLASHFFTTLRPLWKLLWKISAHPLANNGVPHSFILCHQTVFYYLFIYIIFLKPLCSFGSLCHCHPLEGNVLWKVLAMVVSSVPTIQFSIQQTLNKCATEAKSCHLLSDTMSITSRVHSTLELQRTPCSFSSRRFSPSSLSTKFSYPPLCGDDLRIVYSTGRNLVSWPTGQPILIALFQPWMEEDGLAPLKISGSGSDINFNDSLKALGCT